MNMKIELKLGKVHSPLDVQNGNSNVISYSFDHLWKRRGFSQGAVWRLPSYFQLHWGTENQVLRGVGREREREREREKPNDGVRFLSGF